MDRTYLKLNDKTDYAFDARLDALKRKNDSFNLSVHSSDSISLAIKNLPDACATIPLAIDDVQPGQYSLSCAGSFFDFEGRDILITDTFLDSVIHIHQNEVYAFEVTENQASFGSHRFRITLHKELDVPVITLQGNELVSDNLTGNQWLLNGVILEGATYRTYIPLVSGNYQVQLASSGCSALSAPLSFVVTSTENKESISIHPNPATKLLIVTGSNVPINYSIQNLYGQSIQQGSVLTEGDRTIELNVSAGVYIFTAESLQGVARFKLIVR